MLDSQHSPAVTLPSHLLEGFSKRVFDIPLLLPALPCSHSVPRTLHSSVILFVDGDRVQVLDLAAGGLDDGGRT